MTEEKLVPEFIEKIPRRNKPTYVLFRVCFGYVFIFVIAFILGALFFSLFATDVLNNEDLSSSVVAHFCEVFDGCSSCKDYFTVIITASASDLRLLFLLFASGFTYFSGLMTSVFTVCRAFTVGYSLRYLTFIAKTHMENQSVVTAFALFELLFAILMIFLCAKSQIFSYEFRRIRVRKSRLISSPAIYLYMLLYLTAFGLVMILNASGCLTFMLLYG